MKININMKLLSPLSHFGDEKMGTTQIMRTMKFKYNDEFIDIPVFSGNALRGILRRLAMRDYLDKIDIIKEGLSAKMYYTLFVGGALTSGSRFNEIGDKRKIREMCTPLSLFGTALGDQMFEGKLKISIFKPICIETRDYTDIDSNISIYDILEENFYTRRDDLKFNDFNITNIDKNKNSTQMKYEIQCLSSGSELNGNVIIESFNEFEISCLVSILERFKEHPYIGGKSATGHGEVDIRYNIEGNSEKYYIYLKENKDQMRTWLREIEGNL